jgi:hypothetical protein
MLICISNLQIHIFVTVNIWQIFPTNGLNKHLKYFSRILIFATNKFESPFFIQTQVLRVSTVMNFSYWNKMVLSQMCQIFWYITFEYSMKILLWNSKMWRISMAWLARLWRMRMCGNWNAIGHGLHPIPARF